MIFPLSVFFFLRNDIKTREACYFAKFDSAQYQNPTNPHPSHHPTAAIQSQPTTAAQRALDEDQPTKPAVQTPPTRPPHCSLGSQKAGGGNG